MEKKYCKRCDKTWPVTKFRPDEYAPTGYYAYCKNCEYEYQTLYRQNKKKENSGIMYADIKLAKKKCSKCKQTKTKFEFRLDTKLKSGLSSQCKKCIYDQNKIDKAKYGYKPYAQSNPEEWNKYYTEYRRVHQADPVNAKRQFLTQKMWYLEKTGRYLRPVTGHKCDKCGDKCTHNPKASFSDDYVISLLTYKFDIEKMLENVKFLCNKCVYAMREKRKSKKPLL